jgi:hypothetical protein
MAQKIHGMTQPPKGDEAAEEPFAVLAGELELPMTTLSEAVEEARALIAEIEAAVSP